MEIVFIAVQCFKCSTMQVKQRKKSSNKWSCVVCNEKQSVRKVFSQAYMAKDVRKFVQSFNMSRQFVEQQQDENESLGVGDEAVEVERMSANKRTDWSEYIDHNDVYNDNEATGTLGNESETLGNEEVDVEYIDPDVHNENDDDDPEGDLCEPNVVTELPKPLFKKPKLRDNYSASGLEARYIQLKQTPRDLCEPNVVTELPKPLFKKPKLRDDYSAAGLDCEDGAKLRRPVFGKRNVKKKVDNPDKELRTTGKENFKRGSENQLNHNYADKEMGISLNWGEYNKIQHKDNVDHSFAYKATSSIMSKFKRPACENVNHGFTNTGSSSVITKLKRPTSKWNDFLDDDNDLELEMSRCEEVNNVAFERKVSDEIVEDDVHPDFL